MNKYIYIVLFSLFSNFRGTILENKEEISLESQQLNENDPLYLHEMLKEKMKALECFVENRISSKVRYSKRKRDILKKVLKNYTIKVLRNPGILKEDIGIAKNYAAKMVESFWEEVGKFCIHHRGYERVCEQCRNLKFKSRVPFSFVSTVVSHTEDYIINVLKNSNIQEEILERRFQRNINEIKNARSNNLFFYGILFFGFILFFSCLYFYNIENNRCLNSINVLKKDFLSLTRKFNTLTERINEDDNTCLVSIGNLERRFEFLVERLNKIYSSFK